VLWSQVLGFSDSDIAVGLSVTEGTIRHRLSRGMRTMGGWYDRADVIRKTSRQAGDVAVLLSGTAL